MCSKTDDFPHVVFLSQHELLPKEKFLITKHFGKDTVILSKKKRHKSWEEFRTRFEKAIKNREIPIIIAPFEWCLKLLKNGHKFYRLSWDYDAHAGSKESRALIRFSIDLPEWCEIVEKVPFDGEGFQTPQRKFKQRVYVKRTHKTAIKNRA